MPLWRERLLLVPHPKTAINFICEQHVCLSSYHHSKFMSRMSDFDDYPFSMPQN